MRVQNNLKNITQHSVGTNAGTALRQELPAVEMQGEE